MNLPDTLDDLIGIAPDGESQLTKGQRIEQWLTAQWQFRYNEVKHVSEYKKKEGGEWKPLDNYYLNTIKRQLRDEWYLTKEQKEDGTWKEKKTYLTTTVGNLHETIESNFSPRTDVIKDYLINLMDGEPEGTAIDALADTVKMAPWYNETQRGYWRTYLRKSNKRIGVAEAKKMIERLDPSLRKEARIPKNPTDVAKAPRFMPDHGYYS